MMAVTEKTKDNIFDAYMSGWSRADLKRIFQVSDRQVINATKSASKQQKEAHSYRNKYKNRRLRKALKGWDIQFRHIEDRKPTKKEMSKQRKEFKTQSIKGAKGHYKTAKKYKSSKITTLTAYIEGE